MRKILPLILLAAAAAVLFWVFQDGGGDSRDPAAG